MTTALAQFPNGCGGCGGLCCRSQYAGLPPRSAEEIAVLGYTYGRRFDVERAIRSNIGVGEKFATGPCLYLEESGRCSIYEDRPRHCRDFFRTDGCHATRLCAGLTNDDATP